EGVPRGFDRELYYLPPDQGRGVLGMHLERVVESDGLVWISIDSLVPLPLPEGAALRARILSIFGEIIPFTGRHLRYVDSPNDDVGLEELPSGQIRPEEGPLRREVAPPETLDDVPRSGPFGLLGLPTELPLEGLFLTSAQCVPELGIEGEVL